MPELPEVARAVHHLRVHLLSRTIASVTLPAQPSKNSPAPKDAKNPEPDPIIFQTSKNPLTGAQLKKSLEGKIIRGVGQKGKYFWLEIGKSEKEEKDPQGPHVLMHFGMTGWWKFRHDAAADYREMKKAAQEGETIDGARDFINEESEWPPRFWKFEIQTAATPSHPATEAAFVDGRRLGRIRLLHAPASELRRLSPLKENGPDPLLESEDFTLSYLADLCAKRKVPIKSLLLDQGAIAGVGNWVADEVLYSSRVHPEAYAPTLSDAQVKAVHDAVVTVCRTAVDVLADSSKFPKEWLMMHRWGKARKGQDNAKLPNGERITHITVGGRTSAVVLTRQKKGQRSGKEEEPEGEDDGDDDDQEGSNIKDEDAAERVKTKAAVKTQERATKGSPSNSRKRKTEAPSNESEESSSKKRAEDASKTEERSKKTKSSSTSVGNKAKPAAPEDKGSSSVRRSTRKSR